MSVPKRSLILVSFSLLAVFLVSILTVESHSNSAGPLNARCPTCVDNNVHFAIDAQPGLALGLAHVIEYLQLPGRAFDLSSSVIPPNNYRAPPA